MDDRLLRLVAVGLSSCVRGIDTVARFGGDEFVVRLNELGTAIDESASQAQALGDKITVAINQPFNFGDHVRLSTPSIGVVLFGDASDSVDELLRWHHPVRGAVPLTLFIPLAVESGLILVLGARVLQASCIQLVRWSDNPSTRDLILGPSTSASASSGNRIRRQRAGQTANV